jgi:hypothetical protein
METKKYDGCGLLSKRHPGERMTMTEFYDSCQNAEHLLDVLVIATADELRELSRIINYHISYDDKFSPVMEYISLIDEIIKARQ